jgi:hypothetical protein
MSDLRGPEVKIERVDRDLLTYSVTLHLFCGHLAEPNPIYSYHVGDSYHCFRCGLEARS